MLEASPGALMEDAGMPAGQASRNAAVIFSFFHQQRDTNTQHDINNNKRIRIIVIYLNYTYSSSYILKMMLIVVILLNDIPYR